MKMKSILFSCLLLFSCAVIAQQPTASNAAGIPEEIQNKIRTAIVKMALENPTYQILSFDEAEARYNIAIAKSKWLQSFSAAGNLNEYTINRPDNFPSLFPRYNFGININMGMFMNIPAEVKKAKLQVERVAVQKSIEQAKIRQTVLAAYEDYLMNEELNRLQLGMVEDERALVGKAETDFAGNKILLEEYNTIYRRFNNSQQQLATTKRNLAVSKIILESLIGAKIETVENRFRPK